MTSIANIRERLPMQELSDAVLSTHLRRAKRDFKGYIFEADDGHFDEIEAVSCKAIYYICPLLWQHIQNRANEYNETLQTFGDLEVFQQYWLDRAESIPVSTKENAGNTVNTGGSKWIVV